MWPAGGSRVSRKPELRAGFARLFAELDVPIDAADPVRLMLFPEMDAQRDVPEITTACWGILHKSPDDVMCASARMVVKRKDAATPTVLACTLLAYDPQFELGRTLAEAARPVSLNHPYCASFCVLGRSGLQPMTLRRARRRPTAAADRCSAWPARGAISCRRRRRTRSSRRPAPTARHSAGSRHRAGLAPSRHSPTPADPRAVPALGDRLQHIEARGQCHGVVDAQAALAGPVRGVQHKAARVVHRPAGTKPDAARRRHRRHLELAQQVVEIRALQRAVEHQTHRAFRRVRAEIDDAVGEARVFHRRHRDQQLAGQEVGAGRLAPGFARLFHDSESGPVGATVQAPRRAA